MPLAIDEISLVALLGLFAEGETVVSDAARAARQGVGPTRGRGRRAVGAWAATSRRTDDGWRMRSVALRRGRVDSHGDHRMAMLFALAGALGEGAEIAGADSVAISYPSFWTDLAAR